MSRGESLLDWALKETAAANISREPSPHANAANAVLLGATANSALGVQAVGGGFLQALSKADANSELTGAGFTPLLGRSRQQSLDRALIGCLYRA